MAKATKKNRVEPTRRNSGRGAVWAFPKNTLEESIRIAQALEEKNAGRPIGAETLATYVDFRRSDDWRFLDLLKSANMYGLVDGSGAKAVVSLEKTGEDIVAPRSSAQRQEALLQASRNVELFSKVSAFYKGKKIPEDEYFANTLAREFKVDRDRVETFIQVFTHNHRYLKSFAADSEPGAVGALTLAAPSEDTQSRAVGEGKKPVAVREFLDTCFVLMPFGEIEDRYYKDVYVPAIKEAGFEPVRADDLFSSGSVMEQVWDEIRKAKVLLAELTGKNANVFYELGLSHATRKPVIFVTGAMSDVPFDLRHLRVIAYDVREPDWADECRKNITAYLKNARSEPERSIPQPFRELARDASTRSRMTAKSKAS